MIRIITDSVASIPKALAEELNIKVVSLYVNRDGVEYRDADMDHDEFYRDIYDMVNNIPISSQPSQLEMEEAFEEAGHTDGEYCTMCGPNFCAAKLTHDLRKFKK